MDYEWLKKLQINSNDTNFTIYENFMSLKNNIKNKDKNINVTLRMVAESLLQYLNNKYDFIDKNTKSFLNNVLANFKCINVLQTQYHTVAGNCYTWLKGIQKNGNNSVHGNMKIFDKEDVKNKFLFLIDFAYCILKKNYKELDFEFNKEIYLNEFENCYNNVEEKTNHIEKNDNNIILETFNEKDILERIKVLNCELEKEYENVNYDEKKFINSKNIEKFKTIVNYIIEIILKDIGGKDVSELKTTNYFEIYEIYKLFCIDNIELLEKDNVINNLKMSAFEMRRIIDVKFDFRILEWLTEIKKDINTEEEKSFYEKVAQKIDTSDNEKYDTGFYYIDSQKPFIVNDKIYYQINVRKAVDIVSKTSHRMMFSKEKLLDDYSNKITFSTEVIDVLGKENKVFIIKNSEVAIRPCELREIVNLIILKEPEYNRDSSVYKAIMKFINLNRCNLLDIILNEEKFNEFQCELLKYSSAQIFLDAMDKAKDVIQNQKPGHNILRYLIANLEHWVLKSQRMGEYDIFGNYDKKKNAENKYLSYLNITRSSESFDKAPYSIALYGHNPSYEKLIKSIDSNLYYEDIFARRVHQRASELNSLFVDKTELEYENIEACIEAYNSFIRKMCVYKCEEHELQLFENRYIYKRVEIQQMNFIINKLEKKAYSNYDENVYTKMKVFLETKKELNNDQINALTNGFRDSNILILNGEAGSGKTELICNYLTEFFQEKELLYVATTHSVVNNMRKRVKKRFGEHFNNVDFKSVSSLTAKNAKEKNVDVVFFDECKSINNLNMFRMLEKLNFKYAVFVGDIGQIPSIGIGNWFNIICKKLESYELTSQHRTDDKDLIEIWQKVRKFDKSIINTLLNRNIMEIISNDIYSKKDEDEIVLCLNYGGPYGINSINSYFQNNNANKEYRIKELIFKIKDPIIFNEIANHEHYKGVIYNNLKGVIEDIIDFGDKIRFSIKIDKYITKEDVIDISNMDFVAYNSNSNKSILWIEIKKEKDNDEERIESLIPFNVSYASSIHKAQGLQYNSVKIIITPESEEIMDNEIFYTAITRTKKYLKIYITNERVKGKLNVVYEKKDTQDVRFFEQPQKSKKVEVNDKIILKNLETNEKSSIRIRETTESFRICSAGFRGRPIIGEYKTDNPSDPERGIISPKTKLAQELLGKKEGDRIVYFNLKDENDLEQYEYVIYNIIKEKDIEDGKNKNFI